MTLQINVENKVFKQCIVSAWQKDRNEEISLCDIKDFSLNDAVTNTDIINMVKGSCLAEIAKVPNVIMWRSQ